MIERTALVLVGFILLIAAQSTGVSLAAAPATTADGATARLPPDSIKAKIDEIKENASLDETEKSTLIARYKKALSYLESARANDAAADAFRQAIKQEKGSRKKGTLPFLSEEKGDASLFVRVAYVGACFQAERGS